MGDRIWAGVPPRYVTKPARLTQPCIFPGSPNRVPALTGQGKGGNVTSAGWQVALCDNVWHVSSPNGYFSSIGLVIGPILWGHSGPLCHALSLLSLSSLLWTSMRRRRATVAACDSNVGGLALW